ncbi:S-layer homology domain-containing protein [Paenibacillus hodogayensis]|uniref:S-layer homology domain-containing protein n=1 Tax=Paenibacillus hodogayensis TaxID=279208 RepID=A0ABV5W006_9BACL
MWKKLAVPIMLGAALISFSAHAESKTFADSTSHWAKESIQKAVGKGYVDGYEDLTFRPDMSVTRAEFVKMAVTALKLKVSGSTSGTDWYLPYVNAAVQAGIHRWSDFSTGDWNTPITRQEMARMIVRATDKELQKEDVKKTDSELLYLAAKAGLIQGLSGGELGEGEATTRAQSVTVIERILTVNGGGNLEVDKYAVNRAELAWHKTNIFTVMPQFFMKLHSSSKWNPDDMFVETSDGLYRGELDALVAIDLDDPNDPNRQLVNLSDLKWLNLATSKVQPVSDINEAYLLYFKGRVVFNRDTNIYSNTKEYVLFSLIGFEFERDEAKKGNMVSFAPTTYRDFNNGIFPGIVISKKVKTDDSLFIEIRSSAIPPNPTYSKTLLWANPIKQNR